MSHAAAHLEKKLTLLLTEAIRLGTFPGAAAAVGWGAPGSRQELVVTAGTTAGSGSPPVDPRTCFDLASLTKPLATALTLLCLLKEGVVALDAPLPSLLPDAIPADKQGITLRHLLGHASGLPAHRPYFEALGKLPPEERAAALRQRLLAEPLLSAPGETSLYSDLDYLLLGMIVEEKSGLRLDRAVAEKVLQPLGLAEELFFQPLSEKGSFGRNDPRALNQEQGLVSGPRVPQTRESGLSAIHQVCGKADDKGDAVPGDRLQRAFAATEQCPWRGRLLCGEVHDDNAHALGGVAGQAGLFGTVGGVLALVLHLLDVRQGRAVHPNYRPEDLRAFLAHRSGAPGSSLALGFDTPSPAGSSAGRHFSAGSFGHLGFTGTSFWVDPGKELAVVLLTNRVHPSRDNDRIKGFRPLFHDTVVETLF